MNKSAGYEPSELDRTDELPVLTEELVAAVHGTLPALDEIGDDDDTGEHPILSAQPLRTEPLGRGPPPRRSPRLRDESSRHGGPALPPRRPARSEPLPSPTHDTAALAVLQEALHEARREIAASRAERARLTAALDERTRDLEQHKAEVGRQHVQLRGLLADAREKHAALEERLEATKEELAKQARLAAENAAAAAKLQPYRDEIQTLTDYIAGSRERWMQMESVVGSQTERIADLQRELEQRIEREQASEQATHEATAHAAELKAKLTEAMTALRARESELALLERDKTTDGKQRQELDARIAEQRTLLEERQRKLEAAGEAAASLERRLTLTEAQLQGARADHARIEKQLSVRVASLRNVQLPATPAAGQRAGNERRPAPDPAAATSALPVLVCLTSDTAEKHVITEVETTIGRGPECAIRVLTQFVSRVHARLTRENGRVVIEDCGSTNGVFVNSVRVDRKQLQHGDWITIGETQFRFIYEGAR